MAQNNFLQWNPAQINQETDAQFAADNQRNGGATEPAPLRAALANKLFYQLSTFAKAMAQMMAAKGFDMLDADVNALAAQLANLYTTQDGQVKLGFTPVQQGTGVGQLPNNVVKIGWAGARTLITIDATNQGPIVMDSDLLVETQRAEAAEAEIQDQVTTLENAQGGVGVNETGNRAAGISYTNGHPRPIYFSGYCRTSGSGVGNVNVSISPPGGTFFSVYSNQSTASVDGGAAGFAAVVPAGWNYRLDIAGCVQGITSCGEVTL